MGYNFVHKHQMKEFFSGQVFVRIAYKQYLLEHLCKKVDKQIPEFSLRKLPHRLHIYIYISLNYIHRCITNSLNPFEFKV